ncbi:MAG: thiolase domain-containing protein [Patescibacteria group bacterium]|nr:thiolase domain-containing protein [Patescibacteria group bacterium]
MISVSGAYQTKFGELWDRSLEDLILEAGQGAISDARINKTKIDLVLVANMLSGRLDSQDHLGALAVQILELDQTPALRVEAACASSGVALHQAVTAIKAGNAKTVLVIGVEKMTDKSNSQIAQALMGAASSQERQAGLTFVGLYALMARVYFEKYKASKNDLAYVAIKNHRHASRNPKAQYPFPVELETVLKSSCVASPLHLFDCSPISDGAAAVVVTSRPQLKRDVAITASQLATDSVSLSERQSLTELKATKIAGQKAYAQAGISPDNIDIAEVHDCFSIAEIMAVEDLGFCQKGEGFKKIKHGEFDHDGRLPVNLSGGLKACGHPVGATGVKQIVELVTQLRHEAVGRQIKTGKIGLAHNVGGSGATAAVHILRKL